MAARFDFEHLSLELSVADVLERRLLESLGFAQRGGYERLWLGQAIHSRYQERALADDPTYQPEVRVEHTFQHRGWQITIRGRVDGLRRTADGGRIVEEIKSVRRGAELSAPLRELYAQQAAIYAWMLVRRDGVPVQPELILIEIGGEDVERIELGFDLSSTEGAILKRLNGLIKTAEAERMAAMARREAGERLPFPFAELRPGQTEIIAAVERALAGREHLLIEATTGIGKTVAALWPALKYCLTHDKRLFVLTAKTLQQDMAMKVLALLNESGAFNALRLRAKAKMCANSEILCHEEYCPYARDYHAKLLSSDLLAELLTSYPTLEPPAIFAAAKEAEVCPFEVSLELTGRVQATVADYNYAFEPYVALSDFSAEGDLSNIVLVIDEIHNLVDRGRGYFSPELSARQAREAAEVVGRGGDAIHFRIERLCLALAGLIEEHASETLDELALGEGEREQAAVTALPEDALWQLKPAFDNAFVDYLEHRRATKSFIADDPFVDLYFSVLRFLDALAIADRSFAQAVSRSGNEARLKIICRDPSRFLGAVIARTHAAIGLSATLSPPEFYRDLLGFEPARTTVLKVSNPFPVENRRIVIDASVTTTYTERAAHYGALAERLSELASSVPGNCLALFPSYQFLAEVAARLPPTAKRLLIQQRSDGDRERDEILNHLRQSLFGDLFLLAVAGGVFAEGVDYPGDMLRAVAIVGPCLPALTLEQQLLRDYYEERFERGFEYAYVVPGMTRVVQAAGRLIRSPEDSGVIALFDRRFLVRPYRDHLPADWVPEEGLKALTGQPARAAREFFARF